MADTITRERILQIRELARTGRGEVPFTASEMRALCELALMGTAESECSLATELTDLKLSVIAFAGPAAARWADDSNLPKNHLHPQHYDLLERCGARMTDFIRATMPEPAHELGDAERVEPAPTARKA